MPYEAFLESAKALRYDIELLQHHFGTSFEQVCHRLTTLQRPGRKGVPFHMLRVDIAGNVSKRFSLSGLRIPRYGGACPRWNVYAAFLSPGVINAQISVMPDKENYFCIARTVHTSAAKSAMRANLSTPTASTSTIRSGGCRQASNAGLANAWIAANAPFRRSITVSTSMKMCVDCRPMCHPGRPGNTARFDNHARNAEHCGQILTQSVPQERKLHVQACHLSRSY
jgi:hypothetical protein